MSGFFFFFAYLFEYVASPRIRGGGGKGKGRKYLQRKGERSANILERKQKRKIRTLRSIFEGNRRRSSSNWNVLICCVGRSDDEDDECYEIGEGNNFTAKATAALVCFSNDIDGFYYDNTGALNVTIQRFS